MMDSDSEIILIDSDDGSGRPVKSAAVPRVAAQNEMDGRGDDDSSILSFASAQSVANNDKRSAGQKKVKAGGSLVDVINACIDLDSDNNDENSSSSSLSSGIPSPCKWKTTSDRPPSVIHTKSPKATETKKPPGKFKPAKKKCLTNNNKTIHHKEDEMSCCTETSSLSLSNKPKKKKKGLSVAANPNEQSTDAAKPPAKQQRKPKKRQWGRNRKKTATSTSTDDNSAAASGNDSSSIPSTVKTKSNDETANKHFHCYLLRSLDPDHPLMTYIGFTTHPERRIRQHNGVLKAGGARRTKRSGRPWTFVCVIHGFQDKITALQFEWAWQNVNKSMSFREAVGDDALAKKMKRRYGPKNRLEELRILLKECLPFSLYSLTVYFPEREYHDIFSAILRRGKNGNPYRKDCDESAGYDPLMGIEVCSLENMPVAREARELKEKKKAKKDAEKAEKQKKKGGSDDATTNYASDISDWLESAKSMAEEESCWSDFGDHDGEESKCSNLKTIEENNSFDLCDSSEDDDGDDCSDGHAKKMPLDKPAESCQNKKDVDDISKDFLSLSINASKKSVPTGKRAEEDADECDFSTISSTDSDCCLDNDHGSSNQRLSDKDTQHSSSTNPKASRASSPCDVVDLCDSD